MRRIAVILTIAFAILLALPLAALAAAGVPPPQPTLALPSVQVYALLIGSVVPLATYVLNHYAPWLSQPAKAIAHVIVAAVAGGLYQALDTGHLGLNTSTLSVVGTAVAGALVAHKILWLPSGISTRLGGGTNAAP